MATILFVHDIPLEHPGVLYLSEYLKSKGHTVELLVKSCEGKDFWDKARDVKPDWVGFSTILSNQKECYRLATGFKERFGSRTVFGGPYVSYFPQVILDHDEIDIVIRGEAEEALLLLLDSHDRGEDYKTLPNVNFKRDGQLVGNPVLPLEMNLDKYPIPDRSIYYKYAAIRNSYHKQFMSGRGCPYNCYFCFNQEFKKLYDVKGKALVRRHSPERVLEELARCKANHPINRVVFNDDIFIIHDDWLETFLPRYGKEIGVPFSCQARVNSVNERNAELLGKYGCHHVMIGLESGNDRVRREIMGKKFSNEQFLQAVELLHKNGVKVTCYNILACPTETLAEAFDTVTLNVQAKVDHPNHYLYMPIPGTRTDAIAREAGSLEPDFNFDLDTVMTSTYNRSPLKQPEIRQVERLHKLFYIGVRMPWTIPFLRKLVYVNLGPIYIMILLGSLFLRYKRESGATFMQAVIFGFKCLKMF